MWHNLDGQCLNATWHNLSGQCLNAMWHNLDGQCLNATWHILNGQCLNTMWLNLGGHCLNVTWHLSSQWCLTNQKIIWLLCWLVKNTSQKCQPRLGQKVHDLVTTDRLKTTCPKWLRGFFYACPKWVIFYQNFKLKKMGILVLKINLI
jgi:hypothetical protein